MSSDNHNSIRRGVEFLAKEQKKDGSFTGLTSADPLNFKKAIKQQIVFLNILILSCLNSLEETRQVKSIKAKLVKFLLSQKSAHWSFNYLARGSKEAKTKPYPDDLDDTFCALSALYEYNPSLVDGGVLAKAVLLLTALEKKEGGPYKTWLVPDTAFSLWKDVDLAVNTNIGYFLSLREIALPNIVGLIELAIKKKKYVSPYYPNEYAIIYFISRFYKGNGSRKIIDFLLKKQAKNYWGNSINASLAASSLINFNSVAESYEKTINHLISTQKDGGWRPFAFCIDHIVKNDKYYAGSSALTTAFALEAINKFKNSRDELKVQTSDSKIEKVVLSKVIQNYQQRFSGFSKDFREAAVEFANRIVKKDKDVVLLPYYFAHSLHKNISSKFLTNNSDLLTRLGEANLYGWVAYTIYDDFLDDEGNAKELPLANVCLRESAEILASVLPARRPARLWNAGGPAKTGFADYSKNIFDVIDEANYWEVTNCRKSKIPNYGDYSQLANKSLGHALGPLAILFTLGYKENSTEVRNTMSFFKHYIIARQLNDDAHDWEDDLKKGQINAVATMLIKDVKGNMSDPKKLREIFWHKTILGACKDILRHVALAKKDLKKLSIIKNQEVFAGMLMAIEGSANKALEEREETMKFLKTYNTH